jgi:cell division protein FtsB
MRRIKSNRTIILDKLVGYFFIFLALLMFVSLVRSLGRIKKAHERVDVASQRVEELKIANYELERRLEVINDEVYVEQQLRDNLGLAKEGEIVVVLPEDEYLRKLAPKRQVEETSLPEANWKKWFDLFR